MNIPNALTLARIVLVPIIVWLIISHEMAAAFVLFLLAGLSGELHEAVKRTWPCVGEGALDP
jgi:hypothetical protein